MLGSIHDAEDLVQETYVRAWRGFDRFEGRSSVRRWLYAIATRVCLTALQGRARRPLPSGTGPPSDDHRVAVAAYEPAVPWLQPIPDVLIGGGDGGGDPAVVVLDRAQVRLALVAALQLLPARQRAVLTLRDVLAFTSVEVAGILGTSSSAVDSALRRARARLAEAAPTEGLPVEDGPDGPAGPEADAARTRLLDRYVDAFARADPDALVDLLRADVEMEMPPTPTWFTGRPAVVGFLTRRVLRRPEQWRLTPTRANGQPAFVVHELRADGRHDAYGVQVLTLGGGRVARITAFNDPALVPTFGHPVAEQRGGSPAGADRVRPPPDRAG
jgi:RNA polymerase sigma-70 factor (ECF subfamily)